MTHQDVISESLAGWQVMACISRTGASHRQRGHHCQDNVAQVLSRSRDGAPVTVVAMADGHGHPRHFLSDVGSKQACRVATLTVSEWLGDLRLQEGVRTDLEHCRQQLARELPGRIQRHWTSAIQQHWRQQQRTMPAPAGTTQPLTSQPLEPEAMDSQAFSRLPYGCTLAVLVLTPQWWAVTGLGDWDLVRVSSDGVARLLSEERSPNPETESTASLCQADAAQAMAARTQMTGLEPDSEPFAVMISTDGVRKSCGATTDYLTWATELVTSLQRPSAGAPMRSDLSQRLDRLSSRGTGDDVSVAVAVQGSLVMPTRQPDHLHGKTEPQRLPGSKPSITPQESEPRPILQPGLWPLHWLQWTLNHRRSLGVLIVSLGSISILLSLRVLGIWCNDIFLLPEQSGESCRGRDR
ncbi:protein phosphatase 2C domain-containing protein [Synechococcus sp. CBW1107]|uniref:protein phosphatase 2C domain-containing protein n=1 Tax=Synechococcus sp. CBW1107 TaxID=2789857 RepID=UPI002AD4ECAC|nr:protein phosphatase 2C domain-containing protein [Synechococcus sp. CBW1107]CAK6690975.1 hypothetical protein IFHNHDMJ_00923 [Synechococcus sp. CBW1107]